MMATQYMVAQQYLQVLANMVKGSGSSKVVLLPAKTVNDLEKVVRLNCQ